MGLIKTLSFTLATTDDNAIAEAQTTGGATNLILNGNGVVNGVWTSPDNTLKQITMFSSGNIAGVVFTITGKLSPSGVDVTDVITGINNDTVASTQYFYSVSRIAASATVGTSVIAGFGEACATRAILAHHYYFKALSASVEITASSTATVTLQQTLTDILSSPDLTEARIAWMNNDATTPLVNLTSGQTACFYPAPIVAVRLVVTAYSLNPEIILRLVESVDS